MTSSPRGMVGIYLGVVGNIADNIFSSVMLANMMIISNMVALKNLMHQKIKQKNYLEYGSMLQKD
jgi:hypothetical protein